jgi:hypothetical protein
MKTKNNSKIGRVLALTVGVWLSTLIACDRLTNGIEGGEKVAVSLSFGDLEPWGAETIVRGTPATPIETASVALEGNWVLVADLTEEPAPPTRAESWNDGAVMRVVAIDGSSIADEKSYVYQSGSFKPGAGGPILVEPGNYRIVAYSYNAAAAATPLDAGTTVLVSPYNDGSATNDLIMTKAEDSPNPVAITAGAGIPTLTLKHQFCQVKYSENMAPGAPVTISSVSLTNNYAATLTKTSGALTKGTATVQPLDATVPRIVYTGGEVPRLSVSGMVDGAPFTNLISYTTPLVAGKLYTLRINVKRFAWAASNIYWDETNQRLTFKEYGNLCTNNEDKYQGVFFRWGSLVGIDPSPSGATVGNGVPWNSSSTGDTLFVPTYNASVPTGSTWQAKTGETWSGTNPLSLYGEAISANYGGGMDYFASYSDYTNKRGDICRYLSDIGAVSGKYRMPTFYELIKGDNNGSPISGIDYGSWSSGPIGKWTRIGDNWPGSGPSIAVLTKSDGTYTGLTTAGNYDGYARFPAAGYRTNEGLLSYVSAYGFYWSGSAFPGTEWSYDLDFSGIHLHANVENDRNYAWSVRCVLYE